MVRRAADEEPERVLGGSALKVTKDGRRVLSDTLFPGERLASEVAAEDAETERKSQRRSAER